MKWFLFTALIWGGTAFHKTWAQPIKPAPIVTVSLEWENVPGAISYEIEIKSEHFQKTFASKSPLFSVQLPLGDHQVRGRSQDLRGVFGEWSEYTSFSAIPQKVDLKISSEQFKPVVKVDNYKAWAQIKWKPIVGAKKYRFYLKDNMNRVIAVHESKAAHVAFRTRPGNYQYNVTAVYSGNIESDPGEFQPSLIINGRKLDPPTVVSSKADEINKIFRLKADPEIRILAKVEYSPFLGDTWDPLADEKTGPVFNAKQYSQPGRYRLSFRSSLSGYTDSESVIREFVVKPSESALEPSSPTVSN